jgi:glycosyltransferase involved in cell wall biosynthesis
MPDKIKLLVEGLRDTPHAFAIVNQNQLLALKRRGNVDLSARDRSYPNPEWPVVEGMFDAQDERRLAAIPAPKDKPDVTYRIGLPYDFRFGPTGRKLAFVSLEYRSLLPAAVAGRFDAEAIRAATTLEFVTPSQWSAEGLRRLGVGEERIHVVPHGIDPRIFTRDPALRATTRRALNWEAFTILNVGAMTPNKGLQTLVRAFAVVAERVRDVRLALKGTNDLFNSGDEVRRAIGELTTAQRSAVGPRIGYIGDILPVRRLAELYQAADLYVAPYRAEGFNLPVLEAAACGLPSIVTGGGPTDEFTSDDYARRIESRVKTVRTPTISGDELEPDFDHLVHLIETAVDDAMWRAGAGQKAAEAAKAMTWDAVAAKLEAVVARPVR